MSLNIPANLKLVGANLVPNPNVAYTANRRFEGMWSSEWDWTGWIKPQIDYLVGDCGCNCIRSIGAMFGVSAGRVSASQYAAKQLQVAQYLASLGAYYYPVADSVRVDTDYTTPVATMAGIYADQIKAIQGVGNIIGFDLLNEASVGVYTKAYLAALIAGIKSAGVTIPLTASNSETLTGSGATWINDRMELLDYLDFHIYTFPLASTYLDYFLLNTTKDILVSETGKNETGAAGTGGYATVDAYLSDQNSVYRLALSGHPKLRGVMVWAAADLENAATASGQWGTYDTNTTPGKFAARRHKVDQLRRWTRGSIALSKTL